MPDEQNTPDRGPLQPDAAQSLTGRDGSNTDGASQEPGQDVEQEHPTGGDQDSGEEADLDAGDSATQPVTLRELGRDLVRPSRGQIILAVILLVVGMALVMQFRTNTEQAPYQSLRRDELVQLLDNLNQESRRLSGEIAEQKELKQQLESGAGQEDVARKEAQARLDSLRILAGTAPAAGPGIVVVIRDPQGNLTADVLLNAVEELRDAGAEVIEINNSIRVVASTWIAPGSNGILVDGKVVHTPVTIEAIGDPHALEEGARFRGGLVSEVEGPRVNGTVSISQSQDVEIASIHSPPSTQYARPA